jgi:hypothetical protein
VQRAWASFDLFTDKKIAVLIAALFSKLIIIISVLQLVYYAFYPCNMYVRSHTHQRITARNENKRRPPLYANFTADSPECRDN